MFLRLDCPNSRRTVSRIALIPTPPRVARTSALGASVIGVVRALPSALSAATAAVCHPPPHAGRHCARSVRVALRRGGRRPVPPS